MLKSCQIPIYILFFFILTISLVMYSSILKFLFSDSNVEVLDVELESRFTDYVATYNRRYDPEEYLRRKEYFKDSLKEISRLNALHGPPVFGVNKFSDMSEEEMARLLPSTGLRGECRHLRRKSCPPKRERENTTYSDEGDIPLKFDWRDRDKRVVGKVLNQKMCCGCWAFSVVGVMESMWAIAGNSFYSFSVQELIDCSTYNNKCKGGDAVAALDFLCFLDYPIVAEATYPLTLTGDSCGIPHHPPPGRRIAEFTSVCFVNEDFILRLVANHGPVVAVVNSCPWIYYNQGVIQRACPNEWGHLIHVVQIVGYDLTAEVPHYVVRNSWGPDFGIDGYVKLAVHHNVCGIASNVAYFTVK